MLCGAGSTVSLTVFGKPEQYGLFSPAPLAAKTRLSQRCEAIIPDMAENRNRKVHLFRNKAMKMSMPSLLPGFKA